MLFLLLPLGLIPSLAWLAFFLKEDVHPEPKRMIAKVFVYGASVTFLALALQYFFRSALLIYGVTNIQFISFLIFAATEEISKFIVAYLVVRKSEYFDEPIDAMIYLIASALGFAMVENIAILASASSLNQALGVIVLRFVGATLLHALSSGIVGYYWAKSIIKRSHKRTSLILMEGLLIASILHALFNYLIITLKDIVIYPTIFLVVISLVVFWDFEKLKRSDTNYK